jgi:4-amino-4-deoxy-L-arabinose transferase-like glycosyltransferase
MHKPLRAALIGTAIAALVTVPGLGNGTLWDNSETAYGEVAREILLTHDWVVMHLNGAPWFVQPPLYFWIATLLAKVFGVTSFALRLPSALATIAMGGLTAYAVTRQAGVRAGIYAGVVLSTCLMQAVVGRLAIMDALLDLAVAFTIFWWFRAVQTGCDRYFLYGCITAALGFLAKGPVAPVISLLVIVPYFLWERRASGAHLPSWRGWAAGAALFAVIVAPWFIALASRTGLSGIVLMIGHYTFGRYTGTIENQSGAVWYYIPAIILGFFPWIAFIPSAVAFAADRLRTKAESPGDRNVQQMIRLALVWSVLPFIFFSFASTKLPNYVALELPALAVLVALYFDAALQRARSLSALVSTAAVPVTVLFLAIAIVVFSRDNRLTGDLAGMMDNLVAVGAAIFIGCFAAFVLIASGRARDAAPYAIGVSMVFAVGFLALLALPKAERFKPIPHLARIIEKERQPGDRVAILNVSGGNALVFYTRPHVYVLTDPGDGDPGNVQGVPPRSVICAAPRTWLIAPRNGGAPAYGRERRAVAEWGKAALYLYEGAPCSD